MKDINQEIIDKKLENAQISDFDIESGNWVIPKNKHKTILTSIRIDSEDIKIVKVIAKIKGVKYQTLMKMYIHEAINKDKKIYKD